MNTKLIIGILLIVAGIALGLYVGVWVMFIGGIVGVIDSIRAEELEAVVVAISVAKVIFAGVVGVISAWALILPGAAMLSRA